MKKLVLALLVSVVAFGFCSAQQNNYLVNPGNGNGLRFWDASDNYKIHMGNAAEYMYGPVTDYSIKTNMNSGVPGRGWTWGIAGAVPVAAINTLGNMQIAGGFTASGGDIMVASGMLISNLTNSTQIRLNSSGSNYGTIQSDAANIWALGYKISADKSLGTGVVYWNSAGNVGIGTSSPSNIQGWDRVLDVSGPTNSKIVATASSQSYRVGMYAHNSWNGGGGFIGTESNHNLNFMTNYTSRMTLDVNGNLGIGTTTPARPLHINNSGGGIMRLQSPTAIWDIQSDAFYNGNFGVVNYTGGSADITKSILINGSTGNVGIGTSVPDYKLTVKGSVHASEVRVDLNVPGPDYVFEKEYKLTSLEEIKNYIDQNKHLPEVPSAKEMEKNGVQLGEMNMLLLKKVEELTLYILKQEARALEQEARIKTLESVIKEK